MGLAVKFFLYTKEWPVHVAEENVSPGLACIWFKACLTSRQEHLKNLHKASFSTGWPLRLLGQQFTGEVWDNALCFTAGVVF